MKKATDWPPFSFLTFEPERLFWGNLEEQIPLNVWEIGEYRPLRVYR